MSALSKIEWTDATWNPVRGCVKVSPGCAHCYAESFAERFRGVKGHAYEQGFDVRLVPEKLREPLSWKMPRRVFVNSMSDLFQDGVPDQFLHEVYDVMEHCRQHTFQILTKRAARMNEYLSWRYGEGRIPSRHIWHGVSVENQHFANERIPLLMSTPSRIRFISVEPLLEAVTFDGVWGYPGSAEHPQLSRWPIHWVIVGGESGGGARTFQLEWARSIVKECRLAGVACFVKQLGSHPIANYYDRGARDVVEASGEEWPDPIGWHEHDGQPMLSDRVRLRLHKKGGVPAEWPEDLRIREFPTEAGNG